MPITNSYIDNFTVRNTTNRPITLGDLVNVLVPAKKSIDLLKQPRVTKEKINQSHHLQTAVSSGWLVVSKPSKKRKTKRERQATVSDEIYENAVSLGELTDVTLSGVAEDDLLHYDSVTGKWINAQTADTDLHLSIATKTSAYTLTTNDDVILVDASSSTVTITLPSAVGVSGETYHVKKIDSTANNVVIESTGSETIDGELFKIITSQWTSLHLVSNGTSWFVI